jgi:hypothetical protein
MADVVLLPHHAPRCAMQDGDTIALKRAFAQRLAETPAYEGAVVAEMLVRSQGGVPRMASHLVYSKK